MKTTLSKIIAVAVAALAVAYVIVSLVFGVWNPLQWSAARQAQNGGGGGAQNGDGDQNGESESSVLLLSLGEVDEQAPIALSMYTSELNTYELTATINPSNAYVDGLGWYSNNSAVVVTPSETDKFKATVTCTAPFTEQATITCALLDNTEVKATCTADYLSLVTAVDFEGRGVTFKASGGTRFRFNQKANNFYAGLKVSERSEGSIDSDFLIKNWEIELESAFISYLCSKLGIPTTDIKTFVGTTTALTIYTQNPYTAFYSGSTVSEEAFNAAFYDAAQNCPWPYNTDLKYNHDGYARFTLTYTNSYNGTAINDVSKWISIGFTPESYAVAANDVTLNTGNIVFW